MLAIGLAAALIPSGSALAEASWSRSLWERTRADHIEFYAGDHMAWLYGGVVLAATLANTGADAKIDDWYQDRIRHSGTDNFSDFTRLFGEGALTVPLFIGASFSGYIMPDTAVAGALEEWGERSLRSIVIGAPPIFVLQRITRHSRPKADKDEDWKTDNNKGVSGHAFMGAIPFISAAKMTDNMAMKSLCYLGSLLTGYSRVNDEGHYLSHVLLGWGLAYLAETAVDRSMNGARQATRWDPWWINGYVGLSFSVDF